MCGLTNPVEALGGPRTTVPDLIRACVTATPDAPFLRWGRQRWTYAEAGMEIGRFAGWAAGTPYAGDAPRRIASYLPNGPEALWAWLGTSMSGAVYVPLNREHRGALLEDMLARSRADILVTDPVALGSLPDLRATSVRTVLVAGEATAPELPGGVRCAGWSEVVAAPPVDDAAPVPGDIAQVMYTSGTTGRSKAVLLTHNQLCRGAGWLAWSLAMGPDDVIHAWLPLFHLAGQVDAALALLVAGGEIALYPTFSRSRFWSQVDESRATLFIGFSNVLQMLWDMPERPHDRASSLRAGIIGGIPASFHRAFEARFGLRLHDTYGMTECEPLALPRPGVTYPVGSIGHEAPDMELAILDEHDARLPPGEVGEIACRSRVPDVMTPGYEGDEAATLAAFRNQWFHTGDLGRIDEDGVVTFVDRKGHMIRHRGENISSWELEHLIAKHPDVGECCAMAVPSPLGEDDVKVVVSPANGRTIDPASLHAWCQEHMARFMVPRLIEVVSELPRMQTGKVARMALQRAGADTWEAERARVKGG